MTANEIIKIITTNDSYRITCEKINSKYSDDIFQEVCYQILTMPAERLPNQQHLPFWFFCVARNIICKQGKLGFLIYKYEPSKKDDLKIIDIEDNQIIIDDNELHKLENYMIDLSEFENRAILLYIQNKSMVKVAKILNVPYSRLREIKRKLNENINISSKLER